MTVDSVIAPELHNAEIAAIEDLLVHYEDWRALAQLEARERNGELPASIASSGLKTLLLDKLATNPLFMRRQTLLKELERLTRRARADAPGGEGVGGVAPQEDDLTRIRGIDARLERRLNALNITSYAQIAVWEDADVDYFARTLGLDDLIMSEKWIEQAAVLIARQTLAPAKSASSPITGPSVVIPEVAPPITAPRDPVAAGISTKTAAREEPHRQDHDEDQDEGPSRGPVAKPTRKADEKEAARAAPPAGQQPTAAGRTTVHETAGDQGSGRQRDVHDRSAREEKSVGAQARAADQPQGRLPNPPEPARVELASGEMGSKKAPVPSNPKFDCKPPRDDAGESPRAESADEPPKDEEAIVQSPLDASYPPRPPAMPLPVSAYALPLDGLGFEPGGKPIIAAGGEAAEHAPEAEATAFGAAGLKPAFALPAFRYAGAVFGASHDPGVSALLSPPKPKVASSYALIAAEADASTTPDAKTPDAAAAHADAPPQSERDGNLAGAPDGEASQRAGDILERNLPPLPFKPSSKAGREAAASPPPSTHGQPSGVLKEAPLEPEQRTAPLPPAATAAATAAAIAAAQAAAAAVRSAVASPETSRRPAAREPEIETTAQTRQAEPAAGGDAKKAPSAAPPPSSPPQAPVQSAPSEDGLLAAAAARAPAAQSASMPPPLPPSIPAPPPMAGAPVSGSPATRKTVHVEDKQPERPPAAEARVTIRRAEETTVNTVLRVPGGTDVHLRAPRHSEEKFDSRSYAAYHSEVEEARVEIRRTPPGTPSGAALGPDSFSYGGESPGVPRVAGSQVPDAVTRAAAEAAAEAAARAAAALAGARTAVRPPQPPAEADAPAAAPAGPPSKEPPKPPVTMGRFLKALTGQ